MKLRKAQPFISIQAHLNKIIRVQQKYFENVGHFKLFYKSGSREPNLGWVERYGPNPTQPGFFWVGSNPFTPLGKITEMFYVCLQKFHKKT